MGPSLTLPGDSPSVPDGTLPRREAPRARPYLSIFGELVIERVSYGEGPIDVAPLDARLHLPRRQYSYLLQRWLGAFVIDDAHAEAVKKLQTILGLTIPVKASEDLNREQASDVEPFQDSRPVPPAATEEAILVVAADCKGVPLVRSDLAASEAPPAVTRPRGHHRRGKGEKANKKRMAAVGAVYTIEPFRRTADDVIDELDRREAARRRPRPRNKHVRAELLVGQVALFLWLADEILRRDPERTKPLVFLSDGEPALTRAPGGVLARGGGLHPGPVPCAGAPVEGRLVLLRRGEREAAGRGVGRGEAADVAGGPGGLGDPGIARIGHPAGLEGQGPQDGGASDRLSGAQPRADEV